MYRAVLIMGSAADIDAWADFGLRLLPPGGELFLWGFVTAAEGASLSEGVLPAQSLREPLDLKARRHDAIGDEVRIFVDYQPMARIIDDVNQMPADLVIIQAERPADPIGGMPLDEILHALTCDVVIVSGGIPAGSGDVLLSLRGGPNLTLGVRTAMALAGEGAITLFHATDHRSVAPDLMLIANAVPQIRRVITADTDILNGIVREAHGHQAVVLGASFGNPERGGKTASPISDEVFTRTRRPVVLVRGASQETFDFHTPRLSAQQTLPLSARVDQWFAENTFHSSEFADLRDLLALKEKRGHTISIALPALNEEETVGPIIDMLKQHFMDDVPLVDEIVLIDSASTDSTVAIAQSKGIPTYIHQQILTEEVGTFSGKGEALWKSLYVTRGDLIAWIDTDITNIHPRFIYGLLGPLLKHPRIQYVKGFYTRPIQSGGKLQAYGGGRVTELVARPWFNLFYPELSGIIQPLSGEYAGRRSALEQMPFFTGYGVETGLLIDILNRFGLEAIAQTDLEVRVHHNQPLVNLSKMSFAILQVFIARLESRYGVELLDKANRSMKLVIQEPSRFALDIADIGDHERPPMITLPAYRQRHPRSG
jgi:glucosyl-3-phosphoglycerate synthase